MDNDAKMIEIMSSALTNLELKYRNSGIKDRMEIKPELDKLILKFADFQLKLIDEGIITTESDLADMNSIKGEVEAAASKQEMITAIARTLKFIVSKIK